MHKLSDQSILNKDWIRHKQMSKLPNYVEFPRTPGGTLFT